MKSPEEMANSSTPQEKADWLGDQARTPREIIRFLNCIRVDGQLGQLAVAILRVRIAEIAESSSVRLERHTERLVKQTDKLVGLTWAVVPLTVALFFLTAYLSYDVYLKGKGHEKTEPHAAQKQ